MAVNKNFVVKNGLEVNTSLIVANAETQKVGIASTTPQYTLDVSGGIGATDLYVTGVGTFLNDVFVGGNLNVTGDLTYDEVNGRNLRITGLSTFVGISTFESDVWVAGNLNVTGDITYDEVSGRNIIISGLSTFVGFSTFANDLYVAGVVTATSFYGDGSNLTGVAPGLSAAVGVSEEGTFIGAGNTIINFVSTNGAAWDVTSVNGIATATVTPGVSLGLAIALGG